MKSTKGKTFEISTFSEVCNIVNDENIDLLINDFAKWLIYYNELIKRVREENPKETKNIINSKILKSTMIWTDDNKSELTGVSLKTIETGEIFKVDFKNK